MTTERTRRILVTGGSGFIGSALMAELGHLEDAELLNIDIVDPGAAATGSWLRADVLDPAQLASAVHEFAPTDVVHLAARVDVEGDSIADYAVNTVGCDNLLAALAESPSVRRAVFTSTQFVCRPGYVPKNDEDYAPHTAYGESKVLSEKSVRTADAAYAWAIVRPTTVWGPGDQFYRQQFYDVMKRGLYMHPAGTHCRRSYGYVGNVVAQIRRILDGLPGDLDRRALYVGDPVTDILEFVNEFSRQIRGAEVRQVPAPLIRGIALVGDVAKRLRLPFPLTTPRYRSMTEHYPVPIEATIAVVGAGPFSLADGVADTVAYLTEAGVLAA